jgi:outer membrane protein assembly factor BamB
MFRQRIATMLLLAFLILPLQNARAVELRNKLSGLYVSSGLGEIFKYDAGSDLLESVVKSSIDIESISFCEKGFLYILSIDNVLYSLNIISKAIVEIGSTRQSNIHYIACTKTGTLYGMTSNGELYLISRRTGRAYGRSKIGSPFTRGGPIAGKDPRHLFILGNHDFKLGVLGIPGGQIDSVKDPKGTWLLSPASMVVVGEEVYYSSWGSSIYAINTKTGFSRWWISFENIRKISGLSIEP